MSKSNENKGITVRITKRLLQRVLARYPKVYAHQSKNLIKGRRVTLYSADPVPGESKPFGAWCGGLFVTEDKELCRLLKFATKGSK